MSVREKPSIYNQASIYNQGDKKTVWGGKPFEINSNARVQIKQDAIILKKTLENSSNYDGFYMGVEPIYTAEKNFGDLGIGDEIEINFEGLVKKLGTGRTFVFMPSCIFGSSSSQFDINDMSFEINNYDGKCWFKVFNSASGQFNFDYNQIVRIHLFAKKTSSVTMSFKGWYNGYEKLSADVTLDSAKLARTCLLTFGSFGVTQGFKINSEIRQGSFIRYNDEILFGMK